MTFLQSGAIATLALAIAIPIGTAKADYNIKTIGNCTTISEPGSYVIDKVIRATATDLIPAGAGATACIVIAADFVTLDLQGYTITGPGDVPGTFAGGIATVSSGFTREGVVIRNGSVTNFEFGVFACCSGFTVEHIRSVKNTSSGLQYGGSGHIVSNNLSNNGNWGIFGAGTVQIVGNVANNNGNDGIQAQANATATGNIGPRVVGNTANSNGNRGIFAGCPSLLVQNMASGNGDPAQIVTPTVGVGCVRLENSPLP